MAVILSVSIEPKQKEFLDELKLSPSALLQRSINELMLTQGVSKEHLEEMRKKMLRLQDIVMRQGTFIENHGLSTEFLEFN